MIENLVKMSNKYGVNADFVLAGGGNTSYKDITGGLIHVKASGTSLADIQADGFITLKRDKLEFMRQKEYGGSDAEKEAAVLIDLMDARSDKQSLRRPSVQTRYRIDCQPG